MSKRKTRTISPESIAKVILKLIDNFALHADERTTLRLLKTLVAGIDERTEVLLANVIKAADYLLKNHENMGTPPKKARKPKRPSLAERNQTDRTSRIARKALDRITRKINRHLAKTSNKSERQFGHTTCKVDGTCTDAAGFELND